jgi:hypothetical protein
VLGSAISNALEETGDGTLWNGNEEDGNVRSECEEDAGTTRVDGDRNIGGKGR